MPRKSSDQLADDLHDVMAETLPSMVKDHVMEQVKKQVLEQVRDQVPAQISLQIQKAIEDSIPSQVDASVRSYMSGHILHVHPAQSQIASVLEQQYQLYLAMKADPQMQQQDIAIWLALQMKFERTQTPQTACRPSAIRPRYQEDPHDDAHPEGENSVKRQKTSEYEQSKKEKRVMRHSEIHKFCDATLMRVLEGLKSYNNDVKYGYVQKELTSDEVEYLKLFEEEIKKGNSGPEKIVLSLHKFPVVIFNDDDIEE
ncbi:hypothetical protein Tco_1170470 [Tanacetum coccineum]